MEFSGTGSVESTLVNCGMGASVCAGASCKIGIIKRGDITFDEKVTNCQRGGGVAAIIFNNNPVCLSGRLEQDTSATIPAVSISQGNGEYLVASKIGNHKLVTVNVPTSCFESLLCTQYAVI